jgi:phosphatidylserine/phosphatidylglycerophosphate/cardiolipin synthase-like enzyme
MQTEAVFEEIANRIQQEISKAKKSIFIAVAWFTNKNLFNELLIKARNGCSVSIIISNDSINLTLQLILSN